MELIPISYVCILLEIVKHFRFNEPVFRTEYSFGKYYTWITLYTSKDGATPEKSLFFGESSISPGNSRHIAALDAIDGIKKLYPFDVLDVNWVARRSLQRQLDDMKEESSIMEKRIQSLEEQVKQLKQVIRSQAERLALHLGGKTVQDHLTNVEDDEVIQITRSEFEKNFGGLKRKLLFEDCESKECMKPNYIPLDDDDSLTPNSRSFMYYGDGGVLELHGNSSDD